VRVAVLCDDLYHPADVVRRGVEAVGIDRASFEFITDTSDWSANDFDRYDLILLSKANLRSAHDVTPWLTDEIQEAFIDFVERGGGLVVVHSGTCGFRDLPRFREFIGGGFIRHPDQCSVTMDFAGISEMIAPSFVFDEHYIMEMFGNDVDVFMTSTSVHGTQPAGWTRTQGAGRVCVLTPGHNLDVWHHPAFQRLLSDAIVSSTSGRVIQSSHPRCGIVKI
jgi:type 1 glutamine amidotransferase